MHARLIALASITLLISIDLASSLARTQSSQQPKLSLTVQTPGDNTREITPGSKLYPAELKNNGDQTLKLQAIEQRGEYQGRGQSFNCTLQVWEGKWIRVWRDQTPTFNLIDVELKPAERKIVCDLLLPSKVARVGDCARYMLRTRWKEHSSYGVLSKPFVIGNAAPKEGPCSK